MKSLIRAVIAVGSIAGVGLLGIVRSEAQEEALKIVTFNVWGLPTVSLPFIGEVKPGGVENKDLRIHLLCKELKKAYAGGGWDVVLLQEVWETEDQEYLKTCGYPYTAAFDRPDEVSVLSFGSGLVILSRFQLAGARRHPFQENGDTRHVWSDGEAFAGKSVAIVKMIGSPLGDVWIANTHLVSDYSPDGDDYREQRRNQLQQAAAWIEKVTRGEPVIFGGDFNFSVDDPMYGEIGRNILPGFHTDRAAESENTLVEASSAGKKIDHIFVSGHFQASGGHLALDRPVQIRGEKIRLSDHFGFELAAEIPRAVPVAARMEQNPSYEFSGP